jgi:hypothetical protein
MWLAVLGHHVPQMSAFTILFGDMSEMPSYHSLYQRLLAFDAEEAETIMDGHFKIDHASEIMEHVFSPLFAKLELDRLAGFIEAEQKDFAYQTIAGYVKERVEKVHLEKQVKPSDQTNPNSEHEPRQPKVSVVIIPTGNEPEEIMSEMLHLSCLTDLDLDIHTTSSSLLVNQIVKNIETNSFDAAVFCCGSAASEAKTRLICKRIANFDQKLPVFVFKSNQGRHSIAMTTDGLPGPDNRFDTIAKVLEKLGHVNRRLPQSNESKAEASNLSSMKPNGLAIV